MSKNRIQFQRGLSLSTFLKHYGQETQCFDRLFSLKWPHGFVCPRCRHNQNYILNQSHKIQCKSCKHQTSIRAHTLMSHSKLPLTKWFLAIYLITQQKNGLSCLHLKRLLDVNYKTAWLLHQKLMFSMGVEESKSKLSGLIQIDDGFMGGKRRGKRGRGAGGKTPFVMALSLIQGRPYSLKLARMPNLRSQAIRDWACDHLSQNSTLQVDDYPAYQGLAGMGFRIERHVIAKKPILKDTLFQWINTIMGNVKRSIDGTFHALRARYLQHYFNAFVWRFNRRFDLVQCTEDLIQTLVSTPPIFALDLKATLSG